MSVSDTPTVYDIDRRDLARAEEDLDLNLAILVRRRLRSDIYAPVALRAEADRVYGSIKSYGGKAV